MDEKKSGMRRFLAVAAVLLILCLGIALALETLFILLGGSTIFPLGDLSPVASNNKVGVIYVEGELVTDNVADGSGYASSINVVQELRDAQNDKSIKAIVLRVDSPGGTPVAAEEIYSQIMKTKTVKPVVVSMGDMATSAAYYISAPCSRIVASPDSFTGSIGVIWTFQNRSEYYTDVGTSYYVAESGTYKDVGADYRGLSDSEKEYANAIVNEAYERFVTSVAQGRNMSYDDVKKLADGRAYTGADAQKLGLVDDLGGLYDAIDIAARMGNVSGTPVVTCLNQASDSETLLSGKSSNSTIMSLYSDGRTEAESYSYAYPYGRLYM